jgi:hypothetical protein
MLQPRALETWSDVEAERYRSTIDYTGVFMPADVSWREQVAAIGEALPAATEALFSYAAFCTTVLHSLVDVALWRTRPSEVTASAFRRVQLTRENEQSLVERVTQSWALPTDVPSLLSLKHRLRARLAGLPILANRISMGESPLDLNQSDQVFLGLEVISAASTFIEVFDDFVGEPDGKWTLLFDEMEIAPKAIRQKVFQATRSCNQKLLLKVALSPYTEELSPTLDGTAPSPFNDFVQIQLWFAHRESGVHGGQKQFCEELWRSVLEQKGLQPLSPYFCLS